MENFRGVFWGVNGWVPVTESASMVGLYAAVWVAMLGIKWLLKMYGMVRGGQ